MRDPQEFRSLAPSCRERARSSIDPEAIEQLRLWALELADEADAAERREEDEPVADIVIG